MIDRHPHHDTIDARELVERTHASCGPQRRRPRHQATALNRAGSDTTPRVATCRVFHMTGPFTS